MVRIAFLIVAAALMLMEGGASGIESLVRIRFASPLQSLTIWDRKDKGDSPRSKFLPKYQAGLKAEAEKRKELSGKRKGYFPAAGETNWANKAAQAQRLGKKQEDRILEEAFETAAASVESSAPPAESSSKSISSGYQFVGVVNKVSDEKPITWYARKKPADSKWSVRLVHVNRDAIIKDMFNRGKADVFAKYGNTGTFDEETNECIVKPKYEVRERSWRNLWNFSPKHVFTDSAGMYWRERRLRPGLYTDGASVYESSYRYGDGRNGMRQISSFESFLKSPTVDQKTKENIIKRLRKDDPDIVLED